MLAALQGLMPNYVKVVPSIAIAFVSYEQVLFLSHLLLGLTLYCLPLFLLLSSSFVVCFSPGPFLASSFLCCSCAAHALHCMTVHCHSKAWCKG